MSTVGGMHGGGGDGAGGEGRGVVGSGDIPKMTSANMIVLLLMPALIVAIFMICLIYLSGCRCKLGSQKGYKTNRHFPSEDKCVICLRHLDSDKMSETLSLSAESCSLFNLSSPTQSKNHGSLTINNELESNITSGGGDPSNSAAEGVITSGGNTVEGPGGTRKSRSVSWSNMYKQRIFSATALSGIGKHKKQRVVQMRNCSHSYHSDCIKQWMKSNNSCPLCKTRVNSRMLLTFHPHSSPYFSIVTV